MATIEQSNNNNKRHKQRCKSFRFTASRPATRTRSCWDCWSHSCWCLVNMVELLCQRTVLSTSPRERDVRVLDVNVFMVLSTVCTTCLSMQTTACVLLGESSRSINKASSERLASAAAPFESRHYSRKCCSVATVVRSTATSPGFGWRTIKGLLKRVKATRLSFHFDYKGEMSVLFFF